MDVATDESFGRQATTTGDDEDDDADDEDDEEDADVYRAFQQVSEGNKLIRVVMRVSRDETCVSYNKQTVCPFVDLPCFSVSCLQHMALFTYAPV